jgi:hypothetical protein
VVGAYGFGDPFLQLDVFACPRVPKTHVFTGRAWRQRDGFTTPAIKLIIRRARVAVRAGGFQLSSIPVLRRRRRFFSPIVLDKLDTDTQVRLEVETYKDRRQDTTHQC